MQNIITLFYLYHIKLDLLFMTLFLRYMNSQMVNLKIPFKALDIFTLHI